jgi:hypothetical protein
MRIGKMASGNLPVLIEEDDGEEDMAEPIVVNGNDNSSSGIQGKGPSLPSFDSEYLDHRSFCSDDTDGPLLGLLRSPGGSPRTSFNKK